MDAYCSLYILPNLYLFLTFSPSICLVHYPTLPLLLPSISLSLRHLSVSFLFLSLLCIPLSLSIHLSLPCPPDLLLSRSLASQLSISRHVSLYLCKGRAKRGCQRRWRTSLSENRIYDCSALWKKMDETMSTWAQLPHLWARHFFPLF